MTQPLWHLTKNPNWAFDPNYHPIWAYGFGHASAKPGLFVTDQPIYWKPWLGVGPVYAVRVEVPEEAMPPSSESHPEFLITDLDKIRIAEILPLEEVIRRGKDEERAGIPWDRQEYGGFGSVEDWWFHSYEAWDDVRRDLIRVWRTRKGLSSLMREWRDRNPGYKNPMDKNEKQERARRKIR
jgi:hypothetical protein